MKIKLREHKTEIICVFLKIFLLLFFAVIGLFFAVKNKHDFADEVKSVGSEALSTETIRIALTFDDGPHPFYTTQLLDGLKERGVKATFFITGQNAGEYPEIVKRIDEEGHIIGNHTYTHMQLTKNNGEQFKQELIDTNIEITAITGKEVIYVRPPYGCWDKELENELNLFPILWTVDPLDWCSTNTDCIVQRVVSKASDNDIILLHDRYKSTITATLAIIDRLKDKGYEFVTIEDIIFN